EAATQVASLGNPPQAAAPVRRPPRVLLDPPVAGFTLETALSAEPGRCAARWYKALDAQPTRTPRGEGLNVSGPWRDDCGIKDWFVSPLSPERFTEAVVGGLWHEMGGRLGGRVLHGQLRGR